MERKRWQILSLGMNTFTTKYIIEKFEKRKLIKKKRDVFNKIQFGLVFFLIFPPNHFILFSLHLVQLKLDWTNTGEDLIWEAFFLSFSIPSEVTKVPAQCK